MALCSGQLRAAGLGVGGLDLAAVFAAARALAIEATPRLLRELKIMEAVTAKQLAPEEKR